MEKEKGILEVRLQRVALQEADLEGEALAVPGPFIELMVRDTGHGMDDAVKERIFEPYFTTKARGKGTGMGLALVHGIVQGCGGIIRFESEIGKGSTFHIYFPAVLDKRAASEAGTTEEFLPTGRERILVVDDERIIADIQREALERLGYTVETAENGQEALEKFKAAPGDFDLIITDQTMPLLTGAEMAMEMLKIRPDQPIILCTGYSRVITAKEAEALGIRAFLMKPVSRKDLARIVRTVLDGEFCI
jgi:CheY-like chemotaxis protein